LKKYNFKYSKDLLVKITRRTCLIFFIGMAIYGLSGFLHTLSTSYASDDNNYWHTAFLSLQNIRILGVLQRLAICYGICSIAVITIPKKIIPHLIVIILATYFVILVLFNGFVYGPENILSKADIGLLGINHICNDHSIDPEGVLSTIPSVAHVLIGFCFGRICVEVKEMKDKINKLFLYGSMLLIAGLVLQYGCSINKKVWSPTFVMVTCGFGALLLAILIWYIDEKKSFSAKEVFLLIGVNPLICYVFSEILLIVLDTLPLGRDSLRNIIYNCFVSVTGDNCFTSLLFALVVLLATWMLGYVLYRKKIYIKL